MKTPPLVASLLMLIGIAVLCGLGVWQIDRLGWKQDLLKDIAQVSAMEPQTLTAADLVKATEEHKKFLRGTIRGEFLNAASITVQPRVLNERQGAHLITPLRLDDASVLLVNRGWMPLDQTKNIPASTGPVAVSGWLRLPDDPNFFTPANDPARGQWYGIDPEMISETFDLKGILPFVLFAEKAGDSSGDFPIALQGKPDLNNNHLAYALFWFSMAGVMLVIFLLRFVLVKK